jgi:hypothetical protein
MYAKKLAFTSSIISTFVLSSETIINVSDQPTNPMDSSNSNNSTNKEVNTRFMAKQSMSQSSVRKDPAMCG